MGLVKRDRLGRTTNPCITLVAVLLLFGCANEQPTDIPIDPSTQGLLRLGEVALEREEFELALAAADSAARRVPGAAEPHFLQGLIYSRLFRWDESEAAYRRASERDPNYPGVWNNLGNNALHQSAYRKAVSYYKEELARNPAAVPWVSAGKAYREMGIVDSAILAFENAIGLDSTAVSAYLSYAQLLETDGDLDRALPLAQQAVALAPQDIDARFLYGSLLLSAGRTEEAMPHLEAMARARPWNSEAYYKLAQALRRLGREKESEATLVRAEELWTRQSEISSYRKSAAADPDNPYAYAALASALRVGGRYAEAVSAYKIALMLDPENLEFQNNVASLYFLQRDTVAAIRTYQTILEKDPSMIESWLNLGVMYALKGQRESARNAWQEVLARDPDNEGARTFLARLDRTP